MKKNLRDQLLGAAARDPGCEACFELFDQYAEALLRADDVERLFPDIVAHIASCEACREDAEGLMAMLRSEAAEGPR